MRHMLIAAIACVFSAVGLSSQSKADIEAERRAGQDPGTSQVQAAPPTARLTVKTDGKESVSGEYTAITLESGTVIRVKKSDIVSHLVEAPASRAPLPASPTTQSLWMRAEPVEPNAISFENRNDSAWRSCSVTTTTSNSADLGVVDPKEIIVFRTDQFVPPLEGAMSGRRMFVTCTDAAGRTAKADLYVGLPDPTPQLKSTTPQTAPGTFASIRQLCAKRYPDDFVMRNFCEEQQIKALQDLQKRR
jgi:hypothetical protein